MKTLYISIIFTLLLSLAIINTSLPPVQGISGSAYFMKSNSTAKIYADFTIPMLNNQSWDLKPEIVTSLDDFNTKPAGMTIDVDPKSFTGNQHHVHVTYTITAKDNTKGVYPLFLFFCGTSPLVVGLNESEVNPVIYNKFFTAAYSCPAISGGTPDLNIIGYSGMLSKTLSIDSNNTITVTSVSKLGEPPQSPLKQFKSGVALKDIKCAADLQLLIKANSRSPACVKSADVSKLVERGWADRPNSLQEQLDLEHTCIGPNIACRNVVSNSLSESDCGQFYTVPENHSLNTVPVLLMKTNSTACAKLTFTIISNYNDCNGPNCQHVLDVKPTGLIGNLHYEKHDGSFSITPGKDYTNSFKIVTIPGTVDLANYPIGTNYTVTYIIRPLVNATGFYDQSIPRLACERYPLAVGYAADQVNASDFSYIDTLNPPCVSGADGLTKVEVSGMDYKEVTLHLAVLEQAK